MELEVVMRLRTISMLVFAILSLSGLLFSESDRMYIVDLGPLPKGIEKPGVALSQLNNQALPKILVLMTGYESYLAPDSPLFNVWTTLEDYSPGKLIFLGAIVANFEQTPQSVALQYQLTGGKNMKVTQQQTLPAMRVVAIYIKKTLASHVAVYELTATVGKPTPGFPPPGEVIDS